MTVPSPLCLPVDYVPEPGELPAGSRVVHFPNPAFVGRTEAFRTLARALEAGTAAVINQNAVITGCGGIGKTQLATEVAWRYGPAFPGGVFWVSFADPAVIMAEVADCGTGLGLHPEFSRLPIADQVMLVQQYWQQVPPCLLIFDNCEDPALFKEWRPKVGLCRVLVTSRHAAWDGAPKVTVVALSILSRTESLALLGTHRPDLVGQVILEEIAEELGDFPLALHLAGRYLKRYRAAPQGDPARYLKDLQGRTDPLAHVSLTTGTTETDHEPGVARTYAASVARLVPTDLLDTTALSALTHAAFLAPGEPVPLWLLAKTMGQAEDEDFLARLVDAVARLRDLGLVEVDPQGAPILHRLIAAYARQRAEDRDAIGYTVAYAVLRAASAQNKASLPGPLLAWQAHLRHVAEQAAAEGGEQAGGLLNELGYHLKMIADYEGAKKAYERAQAAWEATLGAQHPKVATVVNNLGRVLQDLGDLSGAQTAYERAQTIDEATYGPEHPEVAIGVNNLGLVLQDLGDLSGARAAFERALAIGEAAFGSHHPQVAICANNLGGVLQALGDLSGARAAYERALAIDEASLGPDHPQVAICANNLGLLLHQIGDGTEARQALERALKIFERTLGLEHPNTQIVRGHLTALPNQRSLRRVANWLSSWWRKSP